MADVKVPSKLGSMSHTFQKAWYKKNNMPLPPHLIGSVKQASKDVKPSERVKSMQTKSIQAYGATKGTKVGGEHGSAPMGDTVKPLTKDQWSKIDAAKRAAKAAAAGPKKPLSKSERISAIAAAVRKGKAKHDVPTVDPHDMEHDDLRDLHQSLHVKKSYNESILPGTDSPLENKMMVIASTRVTSAGTKMPKSIAQQMAKKALNAAKPHPIAQLRGEETVVEEKDEQEYGYEGDMAMSQLKSIISNAQRLHDMLEPDTDLPEWVQSKITLAEDYIVTAANYCESDLDEETINEEAEQLDEGQYNWVYSGRVNKKRWSLKMPAGDDISDHLGPDQTRKLARQNPHLEPHEIKAVANSEGEDEEDVTVTHRGKEYTHRVTSNQEPRTVYEEVQNVDEKYMGFKAVEKAAAEGGARDPAAVAAAIGRKKYGKEKFQAMAAAGKRKANEEVVTEAEGSVPTTPKEKELAAHHGDPNRITYGDVIKARLKSAAAKKMGK